MSSEKYQSNQKAASIIFILLLIAAIILPFGYGLDLGPGPNRIRALIWEYLDAPWFSGVRPVSLGQVLEAVIYTLPTYFLLFLMFNSYKSGTEKKPLVFTVILSTFFPALVSLVRIIGWLQGWTQPPPPLSDPYFPIYIPIPIVQILSVILLRVYPIKTNNGVVAS